ncbi:hypothetical protein DITRI_Ditri08aG0169600 [Diplodiscus trichospermus]
MAPFLLSIYLRAAALSRKGFKSKAKHGIRRKEDMEDRFKRLKSEMKGLSEEQKDIREGQRQRSARTQIKLTLMFRILKAREAGDFDTAANLTEMLRLLDQLSLVVQCNSRKRGGKGNKLRVECLVER